MKTVQDSERTWQTPSPSLLTEAIMALLNPTLVSPSSAQSPSQPHRLQGKSSFLSLEHNPQSPAPMSTLFTVLPYWMACGVPHTLSLHLARAQLWPPPEAPQACPPGVPIQHTCIPAPCPDLDLRSSAWVPAALMTVPVQSRGTQQ